MQGIIDQMAAAVARIDALGITLRDIEHGLIDFPALAGGRQVWLCWQLGEIGRGVLARARDRVRVAAPADRAPVTDGPSSARSAGPSVDADGRAKAYRPLAGRGTDRGRASPACTPTPTATSSRRTS